MKTLLFIIAIGIPVAIAFAGYLRTKKQTFSQTKFFQADSALGTSEVSHLTISTSLALGNAIIFLVYLGYSTGFSGMWLQIAWCGGIVLAGLVALKIRRLSIGKTLHGVLGERFAPVAARVAGIASIIGFTLNLGWELVAGMNIFSVLNIPIAYSILLLIILVLSVCLYTVSGGMSGNVWTNKIFNNLSYLSLFALVIFLVFVVRDHSIPLSALSLRPSKAIMFMGIGGFISNLVTSIIWQFVDLSAWQNIASSGERKSANPKHALYLSSLILLSVPGLLGMLSGVLLQHIPNLTADTILPYVVKLLLVHPLWFLVIIPGLIAAMVSTVDGFLLASTFTYYLDVKKRYQNDDYIKRKEITLFMVASALFGAIIVYVVNKLGIIDLFSLVYLTYSAQLVLFPAVMSTLFNIPIKKYYGTSSIVIGLIVTLLVSIYAVVAKDTFILTWIPIFGFAFSGIIAALGIRKNKM